MGANERISTTRNLEPLARLRKERSASEGVSDMPRHLYLYPKCVVRERGCWHWLPWLAFSTNPRLLKSKLKHSDKMSEKCWELTG